MRSHLLLGKVSHRRTRPRRYQLQHDVWYFALDLDELDVVAQRTWLVRRNRRAVVSFRDADHLPEPATDIAADIRRHLRAQGLNTDGGRILLVTNLRVLGYVFNPASFFLCSATSGQLVAVVVEVHNTHGERHLYTLTPDRPGSTFSASMSKAFYVSPFIGPDGGYRVTVRDDDDGLAIGISERVDGVPLLATSLALRRLPLTTRNLVRLLVRYPFVTHKTIALIHWHALRLFLRRVPFHRHAPEQVGSPAHTSMAHGSHR